MALMTLKTSTLVPPDSSIVFPVANAMENVTVVIHDGAGNILRKMQITDPQLLQGNRVARIFWDNWFIGWQGSAKGKRIRANPAVGDYFYYVLGETKEVLLPPLVTEQITMARETRHEESFQPPVTQPPAQMPQWVWLLVGLGALLFLRKGG